jgi:hypothetical protein
MRLVAPTSRGCWTDERQHDDHCSADHDDYDDHGSADYDDHGSADYDDHPCVHVQCGHGHRS